MNRLLVFVLLIVGCVDVSGPTPPAPRYYEPGGLLPGNPNTPHCDPPLVVWWWYGDGQAGWFCGPAPWWSAPT